MDRLRRDPIGVLTIACIGSGPFQIIIQILMYITRFLTNWPPFLILIHAPLPGNFTCINSTIDPCDSECPEYVFDHSVWEKTIVHEWNLVCEYSYIADTTQCVVMAGILVGGLFCGFIADRYGRRTLIFCMLILLFASGFIGAFVPWLWAYFTLRFLGAFAYIGIQLALFALLIEFTSPRFRPISALLFGVPTSLALSMIGLIGYLCRRWDHILLIVSLPLLAIIPFYCNVVPESYRWLLSTGKGDKAIKEFTRAAKCNKHPTEYIEYEIKEFMLRYPSTTYPVGGNYFKLFESKKMALKCLIINTNCFVNGMVYYGSIQYLSRQGDIFLNIAVAGLYQIPFLVIACLVINRIYRKSSLITCYICCFIPLIISNVLVGGPHWLVTVCVGFAIASVNLTFTVLFIYSAELLPTILRTIGMAVAAAFSRIGAMIAPFVVQLHMVEEWLPALIFTVCIFIAASLVICYLPDTRTSALPNTIEEADEL